MRENIHLIQPRHAVTAEIVPFSFEMSYRLPFYESSVSAGLPLPADDRIDSQVDLIGKLVTNPSSTFCVRVNGESMRDSGIFNGSLLLVDGSIEPKAGHVVVAELENGFTVKRLIVKEGIAYLLPENPDFPALRVDNKEIRIIGVVTRVVIELV